ncbi:hypothetical protein IGI04_037220 [Brassica rapa subsp. trilocularis]|uniref:Uncharacterized protein n=1 Tax=Brassica rapa subsp. trilocularis TaxID=1813537 RepID=A0ABQ7LJD9_BRACM|nr:hypothetical protein IGI04_037220 [Brassica rapa subsp. trilocularis]
MVEPERFDRANVEPLVMNKKGRMAGEAGRKRDIVFTREEEMTSKPDTRRPPPHTPSSGAVRRLHVPPSTSLSKQHSWSPDLIREEAWSKHRDTSRNRRRGKSLTDDDLDELKASIELGFGFGSPEVTDPRLSNTLPALELYYAVQKSYNDAVSNKSSSSLSDGDTSPSTLYRTSDDPQTVKTKLKQWARVVACTVNQSPPR